MNAQELTNEEVYETWEAISDLARSIYYDFQLAESFGFDYVDFTDGELNEYIDLLSEFEDLYNRLPDFHLTLRKKYWE